MRSILSGARIAMRKAGAGARRFSGQPSTVPSSAWYKRCVERRSAPPVVHDGGRARDVALDVLAAEELVGEAELDGADLAEARHLVFGLAGIARGVRAVGPRGEGGLGGGDIAAAIRSDNRADGLLARAVGIGVRRIDEIAAALGEGVEDLAALFFGALSQSA
jgi:hypothetical protein